MEWANEDKEALLSLKNNIEFDNIKVKEKLKKILTNNRFIIHVLNNDELEKVDAEPDDYLGINILPYYIIKPTQSNVKNYICYAVSYNEMQRYNDKVKKLRLIFYILCEQKDIIEKDTGLPRHDLLASLIQYEFVWNNYFGNKMKLISDEESVVDSDYACRTLVFEQETSNNIVRTKNGIPQLSNKDILA